MNNNKLQLRSEVASTISLAEIAECRESLKTLTRRMAIELSTKLNRRLHDFGTFEGQEAVTWLCVHCRQNNIPPGLWAQSPSNSFFARLRGKNGSRSQSMDMSQLHIAPPSPTTQSFSPRLSVPLFSKLKNSSPHGKRKSLPASATFTEETSPCHASSFFGKLKSSDHSPTPPLHPFPPSLTSIPSTSLTSPSIDTPPNSTSFFAKLKALSITRIHSTGDLQNDTPPSNNSQSTAFISPKLPPKAFDFAITESHKTSSPQKQPSASSITTTITTSRGSFSVVNSTSTSSAEISPNKKFGPVLAVPTSPRTPRNSISSRRHQLRNSSVSISLSEASRQSFSEEGGRSIVLEDPLLKKIRKRGSSEEAQIAINLNDGGVRHMKKSSDETKKCADENCNNTNNNNNNTHTNAKLFTGRHTHKSSEDKSPRRTSDENVPDRNVAVRVWKLALQIGFIRSVKAKKFSDNHALFRFDVAALGIEDESKDQSNSLTDTRFSTSARASYSSELASSDPTPTSFESIPSSESSPLDQSQSHMESVLSFNTPRGSSHIPGEEVDTSVDQRRWSTVAPPPTLFDYSQLKNFSWPLNADAYVPFARIGSGGFGDVFSACCSTPYGARLVAVKVMDLEKVDHALPWLMQESKVMAQLSHPNLTQIFCSFVSETSVWLVMPLAHGGSCLQIMQANHLKGFSNLGIISYIMSNVVKGLTYLHSHGLLHRDIKADNILISHEGHVLLADFGCAGVVHEEKTDDRDLLTVPAGTRDFMSPEMVHGIGYDERTDIWSLGITAMELFMGSAPSSLREAEAMLEPPQPLDLSNGRPSRSRSISSRSPSSRSSEHLFMLDGHYHHTRAMRRLCRDNMALFREFVDLCLSRNAVSRPLARDLANHPFLQLPENGQEELVRLVKTVRPATALIPNEDLPPFLNRSHRTGRRAMSVPPTPRKSPSGRNLSLHHKKNSSKDDTDFIYVFR